MFWSFVHGVHHSFPPSTSTATATVRTVLPEMVVAHDAPTPPVPTTSLPVLCVRVCIDLRLFSFVYRWPLRVATVARHPSCVPCSLTTGTLWTCFIITITTATLLSPMDTGHRSLGVVRTVVATSLVFPFLVFYFSFSPNTPRHLDFCAAFSLSVIGHRSLSSSAITSKYVRMSSMVGRWYRIDRFPPPFPVDPLLPPPPPPSAC
jgi:hypothetical protein